MLTWRLFFLSRSFISIFATKNQKYMRKFLWMAVVIMIVSSCGEKKSDAAKAPTRVKTLMVSPGTVDNAQTYVGIVEASEETAVSFTSMGVVKYVLVSEGQNVTKGMPLAKMDSEQARNVLLGAAAQVAQANDALERYKMLHDAGSLPEIQWVEIQSKVEQAKAQLEIARKNLQDTKLVAPVSGVVGKVLVKAGETALPSQAVVSILDISTVKVKVGVPEAEVSSIDAHTPTTIQVEAAQKVLKGGRIEKGVVADALTHTYNVYIHVPNGDRSLLPGMVASVNFQTAGSQGISGKSLPVTAVQKTADGSLFVWTVTKDNTARREKVSIGQTHGNHVTITDGLSIGQRVVIEGYQKLSEGTKVVY